MSRRSRGFGFSTLLVAGTQLRYLFDFGAQPRNLFGVDVLEDVLHTAKHLSPQVGFCLANPAKLPFCDEAFDLVFQSLVFTAVLDPRIKQAMAAEVLRVHTLIAHAPPLVDNLLCAQPALLLTQNSTIDLTTSSCCVRESSGKIGSESTCLLASSATGRSPGL